MAHIHEAERVSRNIGLMINLAKTLEFPMLANTQYKKGIGPIVPEIAELLEDVPCPDKVTFCGLSDSGVQEGMALVSAMHTWNLPPSDTRFG